MQMFIIVPHLNKMQWSFGSGKPHGVFQYILLLSAYGSRVRKYPWTVLTELKQDSNAEILNWQLSASSVQDMQVC